MGNPLQKLFKKLFTVSQNQKEEAGVDINSLDIEKSNKPISHIEMQEAKSQVDESILEENLDETVYAQLELKTLSDYICTKAYEEKVIKALQKKGVVNTRLLGKKAVNFILGVSGMNEARTKMMLSKFKGYIPFEVVAQLFTEEEWQGVQNVLDWKLHLDIRTPYKDLKIREVFSETSFEPLNKLAKIKEITTLGEISGDFLASYKNYTGVGEKKYIKTLERLAKYAEVHKAFEMLQIDQQQEFEENYIIHFEPHLYEVFNNYSLGQVGLIYGLDVPRGVKGLKLKQLEGKEINKAIKLMNRPTLEDCLVHINKLIVPSLVFETFSDIVGIEVLTYRYKERLTLEQTAHKIKCSVEEVSKLQIQTLEALTDLLRTSKTVEILSYLNKGDLHISFKMVEQVVGESNCYMLELIKHNAFHDLGYNPTFDMVFVHAETSEEELMEQLDKILPDKFILKEYKEKIEEAIRSIGLLKWQKDVIPKLLQNMGYNLDGKFYSRKIISSSLIVENSNRLKLQDEVLVGTEEGKFVGLEDVAPRLRQLISKALDEGDIKVESFLGQLLQQEEIAVFLMENKIGDSKDLITVLKQVDNTLMGEDVLYR